MPVHVYVYTYVANKHMHMYYNYIELHACYIARQLAIYVLCNTDIYVVLWDEHTQLNTIHPYTTESGLLILLHILVNAFHEFYKDTLWLLLLYILASLNPDANIIM